MGRNRTYQRDQLLDLSLEEFWKSGYSATTISGLVKATGVDKKTLFREFKSKDGLFADVLRLYSQKTTQFIDKTLNSSGTAGLSNIHRYFNGMTMWAKLPGCLLTKTINQLHLVTEEHKTIVNSTLEYLKQSFLNNLQTALDDKTLANKLDIEQAVDFFMFAVQGITTMGNLSPSAMQIKKVVHGVLGFLDPYRQ